MRYQVFQDGKSADSNGYPKITGECWKNSIFKTMDEAIEYAHLWAYPIIRDDLNKSSLISMKLNVPVNMSMGTDCEVMMEIKEVY